MTLFCSHCRSNVDVPPDHAEATIRCGICWSELAVERQFAPAAPVAPAKATTPAIADPFSLRPGKAQKGMEPVEVLLAGVAARMPHLLKPIAAPPSMPLPPPAPPKQTLPRPRTDESLRRKRGTADRPTGEDVVPVYIASKIAMMILIAFVAMIVGYYLLR